MILARSLTLCVLVALVACAPAPGEAGAPGAAAVPRAVARSVVLVSIDTLRADHLGSYGYERPTSPNLDALAQRGARFTRCSSPAPWTVPAHFSMFTGLYPRTHGVVGFRKALAAETRTLAEVLSARGLQTAAFVNVNLFKSDRNFERGFDVFRGVPATPRPQGATNDVIDQALGWLGERSPDERYFLFVHLYDVHSDYIAEDGHLARFTDPTYDGPVTGKTKQLKQVRERQLGPWGAAERRRLIDLYDAGIHQFDADIARFLAAIDDDVLLMVTSDHGEEFLEHGDVLHGRTVYQELVDVPLILVGPGIPPATVVEENVSLVDLMPTALASLGFDAPVGLEGCDLGPGWTGAGLSAERVVFSEADKWLGMQDGEHRRSLRRGDFKLCFDSATEKVEIYDLAADPGELNDLAAQEPELLKALKLELDRFRSGARELDDSFELSPDEIEALRELGYF